MYQIWLQNEGFTTTQDEKTALRNLKESSDIVILKADKGNATVVLDRTDYDKKVFDILSDSSSYQKLNSDPTRKIERILNQKLSSYSSQARKRFGSSGEVCPRFYGLPKIHKPGVPLRPIVSYIGSPLYRLAEYLAQLLCPLLEKTFSVRNSLEFAQQVRERCVRPDEIFVSFDVVSLFPSVPPDFVLNVIRDILSSSATLVIDTSLLAVNHILDLIHFVLTSTAFSFKGEFYKQISGTPMGSPISCVIAELAMERIESAAFRSLTIQPSFYKRYVDDSFAIVCRTEVDSVFSALNSVHPNFKFTIENETDCQLPFLDVLVCRDSSGCIMTKVYRKPTHTDKYLNFDSVQPISHKISVIDSLARRALTIPSSAALKDEELLTVKKSLLLNGYPQKLIMSRFRIVKNRIGALINDPPNLRNKICFPYIPAISEELSRFLRRFDITAVFSPQCRIKNFFPQVKDCSAKSDTPGVVYAVSCRDCVADYVGETGRRLGTRIREHELDVKNKRSSTALAEHCSDTGHIFDFPNARILHRNVNWHRRTFLEAWEIQCRKFGGQVCCNNSSGKINLPACYLGLHLHHCCPQALTMPSGKGENSA
jgi:hypothetical protein